MQEAGLTLAIRCFSPPGGKMSDLSRVAAASLLAAAVALVSMAANAEAQRFIPDITISSTVPPTPSTPPIPPGSGDVNPYGVAFVPPNFPKSNAIAPGDILVSNFNNSSNTQGTGTTIVKLTPNVVTPSMQASVFFTSTPIGLTTALGVLEGGFVVVGNLPNPLSAGSLQFIDRKGKLVPTMTSPLIDGPWDLTIDDDQVHPTIYVSNVHVVSTTSQGTVLQGTVVRLNLTLSSNSVTVTKATVIASGYTTVTDPTAFVLAPTGLAHDLAADILYVASTADNAIFAVPRASTRSGPPNPSTGMMIASGGQLRGPLALAFAPNGDLITSNGDAVNTDPTHPSEIVELTKTGGFVGQFNVDAGTGGAFGFAIALVGQNTARFAFVDDNANDLIVIDQNVETGD
jgi:hypothetical protein